MLSPSLGPDRNDGRALHDRPFVLAAQERETIRLGALPRGAETVLGQFPGALALRARLPDRLPRHLAIRHEYHLEFYIRGGRRGERLAVEERRLDFVWSEPSRGEPTGDASE